MASQITTSIFPSTPSPLTTNGVRVSVESTFLPNHSNFVLNHFVFAYDIRIENLNDFPIQLLTRHWDIYDIEHEVVDGDGVIGEQPILQPNEVYSYQSGTEMYCRHGSMKGFYNFIRLDGNNSNGFQVKIPQFGCIVDTALYPNQAPLGAA